MDSTTCPLFDFPTATPLKLASTPAQVISLDDLRFPKPHTRRDLILASYRCFKGLKMTSLAPELILQVLRFSYVSLQRDSDHKPSGLNILPSELMLRVINDCLLLYMNRFHSAAPNRCLDILELVPNC